MDGGDHEQKFVALQDMNVPQKIHFRDFWSRMFCSVGSSVSVAILCDLTVPWVLCSGAGDRKVRAGAGEVSYGEGTGGTRSTDHDASRAVAFWLATTTISANLRLLSSTF